MPNEIDDLERLLGDLNKASKFIKGKNYELYLALSVDDYLVDWKNSKLDKQFFVDRFNALKPLTEWASKATFNVRDDIMGCTSLRRIAHKECTDATHFIWLDTDICFDDKILFYIDSSIDTISTTDIDKYIVGPECVKIWDTTWDCLVNENFLNKEVGYCKINNPFVDSGEVGEVSLESVINTVPNQPRMKFGGGWFNCLSKPLLDRVPLPESIGHYGPEDTFVMWGSEKLNVLNGEGIQQFKLKNYIVCENYIYRDRTHYDSLIKRIDRKDEFRNKANLSFQQEINNLG
jgi:hypothetical protein